MLIGGSRLKYGAQQPALYHAAAERQPTPSAASEAPPSSLVDAVANEIVDGL